jgi:hypothetical protein
MITQRPMISGKKFTYAGETYDFRYDRFDFRSARANWGHKKARISPTPCARIARYLGKNN